MYIEITVEADIAYVGGSSPVSKSVFSAPVPPEVMTAMQNWLALIPQDLPRERITVTCVLHNTNGQPVTGGAVPMTVS